MFSRTGAKRGGGGNRLVVGAVLKTIDISMLHLLIALAATGIITTNQAEGNLEANASSRMNGRNQNWTSTLCLKCNSSAAVYVISASSPQLFSCHQPQRDMPLSSFLNANLTKDPETDQSESISYNSTRKRNRISRNYYNFFLLQRILSRATWESVSQKCLSQINILVDAMDRRQTWALKVFDASGNPSPGLTLGNSHWLGSKGLCEYIATGKSMRISYSTRFNRSASANLIRSTAPFDFHYSVSYVQHKSPNFFNMQVNADPIPILQIGLCMPSSCTKDDISNLTALHFASLQRQGEGRTQEEEETIELTYQLHRDAKVLCSKIIALPKEFKEKIGYKLLKWLLIVTVFITGLATTSTTIGGGYSQRRETDSYCGSKQLETNPTRRKRTPAITPTQRQSNDEISLESEKSEIAGGAESEGAVPIKYWIAPSVELHCHRILNCFTLTDNFRLAWINSPQSPIPIIDGMRSLCCALLLCFHQSWFMFYTANNQTEFFSHAEQSFALIIANAPVLVDVFFAISGFLHSYNFFGNAVELERIRSGSVMENMKTLGRLLLKRYIRLSILNFLVVLLGQVSYAYLSHMSQFWIFERTDLTCERYWWRNILYIQNLFPVNELCVSWTWSVACEMQFFTLFTVGFFAYVKRPQLMMKVFVLSTVLIATVSLIISIKFQFQITFDVIFETGFSLYISPLARVLPYISGVVLGSLIYNPHLKSWLQNNERLRNLSKYVAMGVLLTIAGCSTLDRTMGYISCSVLLLVVRMSMGTAAVWLIVLSLQVQQRAERDLPWIAVLSCTFFQHISKLSYAIYLLHPLIIQFLYGLRHHSSHLQLVTYVQETLGVMVIVYLISLFVTVFLETPVNKLIKLYVK